MIRAFMIGLRDGLESPWDLSMGMTYDSPARQYAYDQGSILGQRLGRVKDAWARGEGQ